MKSVLSQLNRWRLREQLIRLTWGGARWLAIVGTVLAFACLIDWAIDRYSGSQTWRDVRKSSRIFASSDPLSIGETPFWWCRVPMTLAQLALAAGLLYVLIVRPLMRTPPVDDLAVKAERAFPAFDHRLVTAIQLNRPKADTRGMSKMLIAEVTREAGEIASKHDLLKLVDYRRLGLAAAVAAPIAILWLVFFAANSSLAGILVKRQALLDVEIPRNTELENWTLPIWPTGSEVTVRFKATKKYSEDMVGVLRIVPSATRTETDNDGVEHVIEEQQPEEFYELRHETILGIDTPYFVATLPPMSRDFKFQARLGDGRTKAPGEVKFENPPQLDDKEGLSAEQVLPAYLGMAPDGLPYTRRNEGWTRGEVVDALPQSSVIIKAKFNKPIAKDKDGKLKAKLILIEREGSVRELEPTKPYYASDDRIRAEWGFNTTPHMIGYRIELEDDRGFHNPVAIRRNIRMWEDRPPIVDFKPESTRNPDPTGLDGEGNPKDYEWDMAIGPNGRIMVIYNARSDLGIREANIRYRVIPKGVQMDLYPEEYKRIQHPRDDPGLRVYNRQKLLPAPDPVKGKLGEFIPDLGLFQYSFRGVTPPPSPDWWKIDAGFYPFPSANPATEPGELQAGGRRNFEVSDLRKTLPDMTTAKLEVGDTVELYMEVFDKLTTGPDGKPLDRPAGFTREAKRKIVMSEADVGMAIRQRDESRQRLRDKLQDITNDQIDVFRPKKK